MESIFPIIGIAVIVCAVLVLVGNSKDKRRGVGYYYPHGPASSRAQRAQLDKARELYFAGVSNYRSGDIKSALENFRQADLEGITDATTWLGILSFEDKRFIEAESKWRKAANGGNDMASMLLKTLKDSDFRAPEEKTIELYNNFISFEIRRDPTANLYLTQKAQSLGFHRFAETLNRSLIAAENERRSPRTPWG